MQSRSRDVKRIMNKLPYSSHGTVLTEKWPKASFRVLGHFPVNFVTQLNLPYIDQTGNNCILKCSSNCSLSFHI